MTETVLAHTLKVGDTIRIAEGERKIAKVVFDDPKEYPESVVMTLRFEGYDAPFYCGKNSLQDKVI